MPRAREPAWCLQHHLKHTKYRRAIDMPEITNQKQARAVQHLDFCFMCGGAFGEAPHLKKTLDHVPQKAIFATEDKNFPLQVPAHWKCNNDWSKRDDVVAELIAVVHGKRRELKDSKLEFEVAFDQMAGQPSLGVRGVYLDWHIIRWIRGFHAALYREFLPDQDSTHFCVSLPTPRLMEGSDAEVRMRGLQRSHLQFVEIIKKNRAADRLDRIQCNNGKFTYECVWTHLDDGRDCCVFAIQVYDWQKLGPAHRPRSSGVGLYYPQKGRPIMGAKEVTIEIAASNCNPFDAFAP